MSYIQQGQQREIAYLATSFADLFWKICRRYILFHLTVLLLIGSQIVGLGLFFQTLVQSVMIVFWLGMLFMSIFGYLVLFFYYQTKKSEKLISLCQNYVIEAAKRSPFSKDSTEHRAYMVEAIWEGASFFKMRPIQHRFIFLSPTLVYLVDKWKIWTSWRDLLKIKEILFFYSIEQQVRLIKYNPADLEAHAALAQNYVALASLYRDPKKLLLQESLCWVPPEYHSLAIKQKSKEALHRALEEYQIIDGYVPDDLWVHAQKAELYRELEESELEQLEYEKMLEKDRANGEILYRLGMIYFQKGENAKGLKIYHLLQSIDSKKSQILIDAYDAYALEQYSFEKESGAVF